MGLNPGSLSSQNQSDALDMSFMGTRLEQSIIWEKLNVPFAAFQLLIMPGSWIHFASFNINWRPFTAASNHAFRKDTSVFPAACSQDDVLHVCSSQLNFYFNGMNLEE